MNRYAIDRMFILSQLGYVSLKLTKYPEGDTTMARHWEDKSTFGLYHERPIEGGVIRTYRRWM